MSNIPVPPDVPKEALKYDLYDPEHLEAVNKWHKYFDNPVAKVITEGVGADYSNATYSFTPSQTRV